MKGFRWLTGAGVHRSASHAMRFNVLFFLLFQCLVTSLAFGDERYREVEIADPYIELHTGPGRGYPIFYVEDRGAQVKILKRKTDWFKVQTASGKKGWVKRSQMERTVNALGEATKFKDAVVEDFAQRHWEMGVMGGDFEGADILTVYGGYAFNTNLSTEIAVSKVLGDFSDADMADISLVAQPFPEWRISPFFTLGTGVIRTDPQVTLVQDDERIDQVGYVGTGLRAYLLRRFVLRVQYKNYVIFQNKDDNKEINEWKAGFSVFF